MNKRRGSTGLSNTTIARHCSALRVTVRDMMTTNSYTPGPWVLRENVFGFVDAPDGPVAYISNNPQETGAGRHRPEREANARLIAAAPELVAALEELSTWAETILYRTDVGRELYEDIAPLMNRLPALLARVRGESTGGEG